MSDTISYIGRDIEDAIRLNLITRNDIPLECRKILGDTNGTIVYNLVEDLVRRSLGKPYIGFSEKVGTALKTLKDLNREHIYSSELIKKQTPKIELMFQLLFERYSNDLDNMHKDSDIYREFLQGMSTEYRAQTPNAGVVRDFIAGMTDDYFLEQCRKHLIPQIRLARF